MVNKAPCKRTQHCWPTTPNIVGCYMLLPFAHLVACCWMLLRVVAQSLKPVKLFSQQLPTFLLFRDRRSVAQQCWIRFHSSSNIVGATHGLQRLMGCILPTMHWRSQYYWELLHPFSHHCQHGRSLREQTMEWRDVFLFPASAIFPRNFKRNGCQTVNVIVQNKSTTFWRHFYGQ